MLQRPALTLFAVAWTVAAGPGLAADSLSSGDAVETALGVNPPLEAADRFSAFKQAFLIMLILPLATVDGSRCRAPATFCDGRHGGLATATFLTFYVLPTLYVWFERDRHRGDVTATVPQEVLV